MCYDRLEYLEGIRYHRGPSLVMEGRISLLSSRSRLESVPRI
jgi:hypothetical protein